MHPQKWEGMPAVYLACGILADISHVSKKMRSGFQWHSDVSKNLSLWESQAPTFRKRLNLRVGVPWILTNIPIYITPLF